ncbi:hypothetical protein [Nocardia caishijiensis]|uniref:CYTH domain-containing protein n=1 Tax=Nocardia caishijiensis TaxID=184756 RepID=A0ABQ6YMK7_9NOCA|nr:hypothetical protein [Nocardia caishijiensis]KAF0846830.1 hypothetical protein FNL39_104252 [Nocardia caishijiensis]
MITPIEIKVNLDTDVAVALRRLGCGPDTADVRDIWFAEPDSAGSPALLSGRIVIRLRSGAEDDLTVKLRPCTPAQLSGRWARPFLDEGVRYRIERDWCSPLRMLSASAISGWPAGSLRDCVERGVDVTEALATAQRQFLVSCTPPGVAVDRLRARGPVHALRWTGVALGGLCVDVERWRIADLDLLELAVKITAAPHDSPVGPHLRAAAAQQRLLDAVHALGLTPATGSTKTERALAASARARPGS